MVKLDEVKEELESIEEVKEVNEIYYEGSDKYFGHRILQVACDGMIDSSILTETSIESIETPEDLPSETETGVEFHYIFSPYF
jgi:hypothetical protein